MLRNCKFISYEGGSFRIFGADKLKFILSAPDEEPVVSEALLKLALWMRERFFSPWSQTEPRKAKETLEWVFDRYGKGGIFGENLQPRPSSWAEEQRKASRIGAAGELNRLAASVRPSSLRLMPTDEPVFLSPDLPGESR